MQHFHHDLIKKYTVAVSYLFRDIYVEKTDEAGEVQKTYKVPLTYTAQSKMIRYINSKHSDFNTYPDGIEERYDLKIAQIVPRIGIIDRAPVFDSRRKKAKTEIIYDADKQYELQAPVPYNIPYRVTIYTKTKDDMMQIQEQLMTVFHPELYITVKELPELGIKSNIPIVLDGISYENNEEFGQDDDRYFITHFDLTVKGNFYPRYDTSSGIILYVRARMKDLENEEFYEQLEVDFQELVSITPLELVRNQHITGDGEYRTDADGNLRGFKLPPEE